MKIIADCCSNWEDMNHAYRMIKALAQKGIKYIKFQLFKKEQCPEEYHSKVLTEENAYYLFWCGKILGVNVFFTPCYLEAVDICERIGVCMYKVRYADRHNKPLIHKIAMTKKPMLISGVDLFCVPKYPADPKEYCVNGYYIGISDHTSTFELFQYYHNFPNIEWFEMHVKDTDNCLEAQWSKNIGDL